MMMTATYSPEDNKLRLYSALRLDADTYARVKAAGFSWAAKQDLFVAPAWTPDRADLLIALCGDIGDEDTTLVDRAEERSERFADYRDRRLADAESAREAVDALASGIPLGQPILVGHHSEKRARKDAARIETGMRKAVNMWRTAEYWRGRAAGALHHAKYKERPDVRQRRIKGLEAEKRKRERIRDEAAKWIRAWGTLARPAEEHKIRPGVYADGAPKADAETQLKRALFIANYSHVSILVNAAERQYVPIWSLLSDGKITPREAQIRSLKAHGRTIAHAQRWIEHLSNRLEYERAMLGESGGTVAQRTGPEKGGACRCWASPRGGWSIIHKVNKVSVSILDNWGNGGANFKRTIPFDKLAAVMTAADVAEKRAAGLLAESSDGRGFFLLDEPVAARTPRQDAPDPAAAPFEAMRDTLAAGIRVVSAPQLFPTPPAVADQVVALADIQPGHEVLEPSAGTGALCDAVWRAQPAASVFAVEVNHALAEALARRLAAPADAAAGICRNVLQADFLACNGNLGQFDRIVANPPFVDGADIKHILHARGMLKPGGRLVSVCAAGPRQRAALEPIADAWIDLPADAFKESGTGVRAAIVVLGAA